MRDAAGASHHSAKRSALRRKVVSLAAVPRKAGRSTSAVPSRSFYFAPLLRVSSLCAPKSSLITTPPFITNLTRSISVMSCSGSPEVAIRSANLSFLIAPALSCQWINPGIHRGRHTQRVERRRSPTHEDGKHLALHAMRTVAGSVEDSALPVGNWGGAASISESYPGL